MAGRKPGDPMWGMPAGSLAKDHVAPLVISEEDNIPCTAVSEEKVQDLTPRPVLTAFEQELRRLINRMSMENESNTPDFILAEYMNACLAAYTFATRRREQWYGREVF
jgi:hypothetical protein